MAKNQNTFAKRQRERKKKEKAQMKRERRLIRKQSGPQPVAESGELAHNGFEQSAIDITDVEPEKDG